ncbi:MAG: VanW family protein [Labilithrix sp.]|nr:VanW family protein [Labilithrix sp.]
MKLVRRQLLALGSLLAAFPRAAIAGEPRVALGRFTTTYAIDTEHKTRAFNVELAAEAVDGRTIAPGATFSFNDAVGERTAAFGYAKSVVLRDGMLAEGVGGGACQVASTLHAAALLAGLDVVARAPHSRPSAYIRMGLDATVAFPKVDLRLKNSGVVAVVLHARAARGVLEVWIDARGTVRPDVSLQSEILDRTPFARVVERDRAITDDKAHRKAFGIPGYRVRRTREVRAADGSVRRDVRIDVYPPTNEIVRVAPSFDESRLGARSGDEDEDEAAPAEIVVEPGAARPVRVQVRPTAVVTLDNGGP